MDKIMEMLKKYWYVLAGVGVYLMFFRNKKTRQKTRTRTKKIYVRARGYGSRMRSKFRR